MHASMDLPVVGYMLNLLLILLIITLASTNNTGIRHTPFRSETHFGFTFSFPLKFSFLKTSHENFNSDASDRLLQFYYVRFYKQYFRQYLNSIFSTLRRSIPLKLCKRMYFTWF